MGIHADIRKAQGGKAPRKRRYSVVVEETAYLTESRTVPWEVEASDEDDARDNYAEGHEGDTEYGDTETSHVDFQGIGSVTLLDAGQCPECAADLDKDEQPEWTVYCPDCRCDAEDECSNLRCECQEHTLQGVLPYGESKETAATAGDAVEAVLQHDGGADVNQATHNAQESDQAEDRQDG